VQKYTYLADFKFYMVALEVQWQPQRPWRPLRSRRTLIMDSGSKIHVNRYPLHIFKFDMVASEAMEATEVKEDLKIRIGN